MQFAATIYEAVSRIEDAAAVFRFKARQTSGEYDDLGGRWTDSRARQYEQRHLQPQRETMEEGERLCRQFAELGATAKSNAAEAENQIAAFFGRQQEFESSASETLSALEAAAQLTTRSNSEAAPLQGEIEALNGSICAATEDPG